MAVRKLIKGYLVANWQDIIKQLLLNDYWDGDDDGSDGDDGDDNDYGRLRNDGRYDESNKPWNISSVGNEKPTTLGSVSCDT